MGMGKDYQGPEIEAVVFYSEKHNGTDGRRLATDLAGSYGIVSSVVECGGMEEKLKSTPATRRIILIDCITEYLSNRLNVIGRPWVCALSSVFADLYSLYRTGLVFAEMNIHHIVSNCQVFVDKFPEFSQFSYRPVLPAHSPIPDPRLPWTLANPQAEEGEIKAFGCWVPNVEDRDWCLVYMAKGIVPGDVGVFVDSAAKRLPQGLEDSTVGTGKKGRWMVYVPAPRITDYRAGVIPYEILEQLSRGTPVLTIDHQILKPVKPYIYAAQNMKEFAEFFNQAVQDPAGFRAGRPKLPPEFAPTVDDVRQIMEKAFHKFLTEGKMNENPS
jgi:hypothetical protein